MENEGVYVHASTNTDVMWFSPKWTCGDGGVESGILHGGDAFILAIFRETDGVGHGEFNGAWCDWDQSGGEHTWPFICEALIET